MTNCLFANNNLVDSFAGTGVLSAKSDLALGSSPDDYDALTDVKVLLQGCQFRGNKAAHELVLEGGTTLHQTVFFSDELSMTVCAIERRCENCNQWGPQCTMMSTSGLNDVADKSWFSTANDPTLLQIQQACFCTERSLMLFLCSLCMCNLVRVSHCVLPLRPCMSMLGSPSIAERLSHTHERYCIQF